MNPRCSARVHHGRPDPGRERDGAGLGLSIVRMIAEAHGGSANASNAPGGGADVWVAVPR